MLPLKHLSTKTRSLDKGERLFQQGDPARAIFSLETGRLRLERRTFDGGLVLIHTAFAGEFFAEASLFSDAYHCDALAAARSTVRVYPKTAVLNLIRSEPDMALAFLATVARQLQRTRQRLELRSVRSAKERLMLYLQLQADSDGRVAVPGELQEIAAEVGLTREALYRALAELDENGQIGRSAGTILIRKSLDL